MRVSKKPEVRRAELLDAAIELFLEQGVGRTAITHIVRRVGVAQGTFYYHFSSKDELLQAAVERMTDPLVEHVSAVADAANTDAPTKLRKVLTLLFLAMNANRDLIARLRQPHNDLLHSKIGDTLTARLLPLVSKVVDEGCRSGCFDVPLRTETVEILLASLTYPTRSHGATETDAARLARLRDATETLFFRALGAGDKETPNGK